MNLMPPTTLAELAADGLFASTALDLCWRQLKQVTGTEINFQGDIASTEGRADQADFSDQNAASEGSPAPAYAEDVPVEVRIYTGEGTVDVKGHRIAVLNGASWTWATAAERSLDIAELHGSTQASELLLAAARAIEGGNTILIGDQADGNMAAISVDIAQAKPAKNHAVLPAPASIATENVLISGIGDPLLDQIDEMRAVAAFAHARGLEIEEAGTGLRLHGGSSANEDGTDITVDFLDGHISAISAPQHGRSEWRVEDIAADGYFLAIEHALWFAANYPEAAKNHIPVNLETGHVLVDESAKLEADAVIIATLTNGVFTWAWADEQLAALPSQAPLLKLRNFGIDKFVPALVRKSMPADTARELTLPQVAMPILNMWKVVTVKLNDSTTGIALIDAPELALPRLTPEVETSVLSIRPPEHIDVNRAFEAYSAMRHS